MDYKQREKLLLVLASTITDGDLLNADLICPVCKENKIVFSFTRIPNLKIYGLFIECNHCKYRQHYSLITKPKNFNDTLVLERYQILEDQVAEKMNRKLR